MPSGESEEARRSRRVVRQALDFLNDQAGRVVEAGQRATLVRTTLEKLERAHPELVSGSVGRAALGTMVIAAALGVFALDVILFNATAEFFAHQTFPDSPSFITAARFVLPGAFLWVEVLTGLRIHTAREDWDETGNFWPYAGWLLFGTALTLAAPLSVAATLRAAQAGAANEAGNLALDWQMYGLVLTAFAAHAVVVFGGRQGHDAKVWLFFATERRARTIVLRHHERTRLNALRQVQRTFSRFQSLRDAHNASYPDRQIGPSPFTRSARDALREIMGQEVFVSTEPPPQAEPTRDEPARAVVAPYQQAAAEPAPPPVAAPAEPIGSELGPNDGDDVTVRNDDSEVKP